MRRVKRRQLEPRVIDLNINKETSSSGQQILMAALDPSSSHGHHQQQQQAVIPNKPYFEPAWPRNVSVILGQPVGLKCRTRLLGDRMVSVAHNAHSLPGSLMGILLATADEWKCLPPSLSIECARPAWLYRLSRPNPIRNYISLSRL